MAKRNTSIPRNCLTCDVLFRAIPFEINKGKGKYCSTSCYQKRPRPGLKERFESKITKTETCWVWNAATDQDGYGMLAINSRNRAKHAHRLAYEFAFGEIPKGMCVLHRCDNPPCVRPDHLFLGTHADNCADRMAKRRTRGEFKKGTGHPQAILNDDAVREIRRLCAAGTTQKSLAERFKINPASISDLIRGKTWKHVI